MKGLDGIFLKDKVDIAYSTYQNLILSEGKKE
jgi:hypothetical protein